jgi:hypothetical protein
LKFVARVVQLIPRTQCGHSPTRDDPVPTKQSSFDHSSSRFRVFWGNIPRSFGVRRTEASSRLQRTHPVGRDVRAGGAACRWGQFYCELNIYPVFAQAANLLRVVSRWTFSHFDPRTFATSTAGSHLTIWPNVTQVDCCGFPDPELPCVDPRPHYLYDQTKLACRDQQMACHREDEVFAARS